MLWTWRLKRKPPGCSRRTSCFSWQVSRRAQFCEDSHSHLRNRSFLKAQISQKHLGLGNGVERVSQEDTELLTGQGCSEGWGAALRHVAAPGSFTEWEMAGWRWEADGVPVTWVLGLKS